MALKLGKGSAFVKSKLRRIPQKDEVWEADFLLEADYWTGLVVEQAHGDVLATRMCDLTPTVNDLAALLADAIQRPWVEVRQHRPCRICLGDNAEWEELAPHLEQIEIEVVVSSDLAAWQAAATGYQSPFKDLWLSLRSRSTEE